MLMFVNVCGGFCDFWHQMLMGNGADVDDDEDEDDKEDMVLMKAMLTMRMMVTRVMAVGAVDGSG